MWNDVWLEWRFPGFLGFLGNELGIMSTRPSGANPARPAFCHVLTTRPCVFFVVGAFPSVSICVIMLCANWALTGDEPIASATVNDPLAHPATIHARSSPIPSILGNSYELRRDPPVKPVRKPAA
jgi:hypothetical protein